MPVLRSNRGSILNDYHAVTVNTDLFLLYKNCKLLSVLCQIFSSCLL
jgi:hypothetical protein